MSADSDIYRLIAMTGTETVKAGFYVRSRVFAKACLERLAEYVSMRINGSREDVYIFGVEENGPDSYIVRDMKTSAWKLTVSMKKVEGEMDSDVPVWKNISMGRMINGIGKFAWQINYDMQSENS